MRKKTVLEILLLIGVLLIVPNLSYQVLLILLKPQYPYARIEQSHTPLLQFFYDIYEFGFVLIAVSILTGLYLYIRRLRKAEKRLYQIQHF